ncbi:UNVERIFIED_CONTAM: hypothetical protein Sangu_2539000 [Sesamum angustifolium]|uniref:Uncharacterized protein n=1 Tax=Sesamum angustifolium TaxID=2727405 RepID=A0AAW2JAQ4_9LAMI
MNSTLLRPVTSEEIMLTLKQMHPLKSPGPDEVLSGLIHKVEVEGRIEGIAVSRLGTSPSYTWRSIWYSRDILETCIRWKIGDGHAIPITGHPRLPKPTTFQLISRPNTLSEASTVSSLIKPNDEWNESLTRANFYALDAECILGISIGGSQSRDEFVWHFEKSGWFSV